MSRHESQRPNVYKDSASAMEAILALHFPEGSIVDLNFGLGVFYRRAGRERVVGLDRRLTGHVVADNKRLPFAVDSFDVAVVDPPYKRGDGLKYEQRYGIAPKTETKVTRDYLGTIDSAIKVARAGLIVKVQDGTDGHRFHPRTFTVASHVLASTGLLPHDICMNVRGSPARLPSTMAQGTPHFFQNAVCYWLVYRWRQKYPFKPVRF